MKSRSKQHGATLVVGLVMLVVLTLLVVSAIRSSNINMRISGNMQAQEETAAAAQQAIEQVISTNFTISPASQVIAVDINSDGTTDYTATVPAPTCTGSLSLVNADLNPDNPSDASCISSGTAQNTGMIVSGAAGAGTLLGTSWCYLQQWEIQAQVTDTRTSATTTNVQGISMRVPAGTGCS